MHKMGRHYSRNIGLSVLLFLTLGLAFGSAKLRGISGSFEGLKKWATNPSIRDEIRGKTLRELGAVERQADTYGTNTDQARRTQADASVGEPMYSYFAVSRYKRLNVNRSRLASSYLTPTSCYATRDRSTTNLVRRSRTSEIRPDFVD
jgi:hypothetical protein